MNIPHNSDIQQLGTMHILILFVTISFACFMKTSAIQWIDCGKLAIVIELY